mmetsp:Transcript_63850/g.149931  ORF Transcript_63850/g.149931 Transcript_63850/m.149931 type:complete len:218 (-) Transcript_63850:29-682(-)
MSRPSCCNTCFWPARHSWRTEPTTPRLTSFAHACRAPAASCSGSLRGDSGNLFVSKPNCTFARSATAAVNFVFISASPKCRLTVSNSCRRAAKYTCKSSFTPVVHRRCSAARVARKRSKALLTHSSSSALRCRKASSSSASAKASGWACQRSSSVSAVSASLARSVYRPRRWMTSMRKGSASSPKADIPSSVTQNTWQPSRGDPGWKASVLDFYTYF